jgi:hypothetical protein
MVHKPKHKVHSFRGLLGDGGQHEINLERQNANVAYRIIKFNGIPKDPMTLDQEPVCKIYREEQTSIDGNVDLGEPALIAVLAQKWQADVAVSSTDGAVIIMDNILFSRNIYVTHKDMAGGGRDCNYYLELEEVPVSNSTLMQIKLGTARTNINAKMGA